MEVELGINITPTHLLPITKDPKDPVFLSTETDTLFILYANLKEYQWEKLKIDKNEDGTQLAVSGEKVVPSFQTFRRFRPTSQVRKFRKVFWIPDGVVLDQIKARFNEKESFLWIFMPKSVSGVGVGVGVGVAEVKEEEIGTGSHRRTRPVPDKVPEREIPRKNEQEMKEGKKDVPQHEPQEVKEAIPKTEVAERENSIKNEQEMKEGKKDVPQHEPQEVKEAIPKTEVAERENSIKNEQEMKEKKKDVKVTDEVVGRLPHSEEVEEAIPQKEAAERENPRKNEQEMEEGKKDVKVADEVLGRLPQHEPKEVEEAIPQKEAAEGENPRKNEQEMEEGKKEAEYNARTDEVPTTDEVVGRLPHHEPEEVKEAMLKKEAADLTMIRPEEEPTRLNKQEYNAHEENGEVETHLSQKESNTEIQEEAQLKSEQESDPTESLKPDHPEEVQGIRNDIQAEIDPVIPPQKNVAYREDLLAPSKKLRLWSPCFFAGSAILVSIVVLVIHFTRRKRR